MLIDEVNGILKKRHISYYRLGKLIGSSTAQVSRTLQGKHEPSIAFIEKIVAAIGCKIKIEE